MTPPRPTPISRRPSLKLSSMLISSIRRSGWCKRQDVDARAESQATRALGDGPEEHVLRGRETVDRRRVMLREVIGIKSRGVEALDLQQALTIDPIEPQSRHRLDVVEDAKFHVAEYMTNFAPPMSERHVSPPTPAAALPGRGFARPRPLAGNLNITGACFGGRRSRRASRSCFSCRWPSSAPRSI